MKSLYQARDMLEAQQLRDMLAAHHIESVVLGGYLSGAAGELPALSFPVIWLAEDDDYRRARQLLDEHLRELERRAAMAPWFCATCGESVEGSFDCCWNCGRSRDLVE